MVAVCHLGFTQFQILVSNQVKRVKAHHNTKFYLNRSNGCEDIMFNGFQDGTHLPSWIFFKFDHFNS